MAVHDPAGNGDGVAVQPLEQMFPADQAEPLAVAVIGEGEHHIGAAAHQLLMKLLDHFRVVDHDFGHIAPRLQIAAPLHLEEVAAAVDDRLSGGQAFGKRSGHGRPPLFAERKPDRTDERESPVCDLDAPVCGMAERGGKPARAAKPAIRAPSCAGGARWPSAPILNINFLY